MTYWFVSSEGDVISVYKDKPLWLLKDCDNGRYSYHFNIGKDTINNKNIELHNLIGLVFGSYRFGKAKELLDQFGIYAFGVLDNKKVAVNGHHIDCNKSNNRADNIEFLTSYAHNLLESAPDFGSASEEDINNYMDTVKKLVKRETPDKNTVIYSGDYGKLLCSGDYLIDKQEQWNKFRGEYKVIIK